ncbi:DNA-binding CsgD family transcriptional regulator [Streptosporangium becharense]|uniref:DNA-binding CsgD family transcriptional regulator n=1 Tax=Streptosporangium becharense TaxID=1816182 RepID=A0A7W9IBP5_9ACTN|nr:LuxR family transcriptional regulator [Streptosporangium becharense]MBB2913678.1 DNA-binding CsgD family transcriptional regulator [Streptosporangium becharense]MBB5817759.1 DNA-binding CsgD family transcriptional regulator [Streptosporangium becharense]
MASPTAVPSPALHGRDAELTALLRLLDAARGGSGGTMVLRGARGTGRSALLGAAAGLADGFAVLTTRGTVAESRLPYAGLHGLLRPFADRLAVLPAAQAAALAAALELGTADGGLALPAAVLNLLASAGRPVLACVDDVHHLDPPSREVIFFVARRLAGEPIALLIGAGDTPSGAGDGPAVPDDVPVLELGPLDAAAARRLAGDLAPELAEDVRASLLEVARGNPLAIVELVGSLTPEQMSGAAAPPETPPRDGRLWRAHTARLAALPGATADVLLLLAADPDLDTATLLRAVRPGCALTALEPAERAGVIVRLAGDRYDFRDPLMRAVAYSAASPARRRAAHRLLAGLLDCEHRRLRRAWHRAAALDGPVEELAGELAGAAAAAGPRDGHPAPYLALERAAELTAHDDVRAARLAAAADRAWHAGLPWRARSLLARLRSVTVPEEVRDQAELVRGNLELRSGRTTSAGEGLLAAAEALLPRDRDRAVRVLIRAGEASYLAGDDRRFLAIARRAAALRRPDDPAAVRLMFEYLAGTAATFRGRHREATGPLLRVLELAPLVRDPSVLVWAGVASLLLGDDVRALRLATRAVETARARAMPATVPQVLELMIQAEIWMGRYASAAANAVEGLRLARESGRLNSAGQHLAWLALTTAVEGDEETCRIRAASAIALAGAHGLGLAGAVGHWALAQLDLAAGRHADAAERLRATARPDGANGHLVVRVMATPHFVEAAVRTGDRERARAALRVLDGWVSSTRSPDRRALAERCHALLAGPGEAEERFAAALDLHRGGCCEFETARTQLLFGGALRRNRRPGAAREHLHGALETFERSGARLWAARARAELRAAGESVRSPRPKVAEKLTAQQYEIARIVAAGATNREVAARLFLSPRTVEHHLRNIFTRLGVRSRVELARLMS